MVQYYPRHVFAVLGLTCDSIFFLDEQSSVNISHLEHHRHHQQTGWMPNAFLFTIHALHGKYTAYRDTHLKIGFFSIVYKITVNGKKKKKRN